MEDVVGTACLLCLSRTQLHRKVTDLSLLLTRGDQKSFLPGVRLAGAGRHSSHAGT